MKRLHRRMEGTPRWSVDSPDVALVPVAAPVVLDPCWPAVPQHFILPLVVCSAQRESLLAPQQRVAPVATEVGEDAADRGPLPRGHADIARTVGMLQHLRTPGPAEGLPLFRR